MAREVTRSTLRRCLSALPYSELRWIADFYGLPPLLSRLDIELALEAKPDAPRRVLDRLEVAMMKERADA